MRSISEALQNQEVLVFLAICLVLSVIVVTVATLPSIVANLRGHHNRGAITVLNLLAILCSFGFFLIVPALIALVMWFVALVWACTAIQHPGRPVVVERVVTMIPPQGAVPYPTATPNRAIPSPSPPPIQTPPAGSGAAPVEIVVDEDDDVIEEFRPGIAERFQSLPDWLQMALIGLVVAVLPVVAIVAFFTLW